MPYVSTAVRTQETFQLLDGNLVYSSHNLDLLYSCSLLDFQDLITTFPEEHEAVLIVGHNPTITQLVQKLTCTPYQFCPSGCVVLKGEEEWAQAFQQEWKVESHNAELKGS